MEDFLANMVTLQYQLKNKLYGLSPWAKYTKWLPLVSEISANFCK
jgi:hypothetical protein